MKRELNAMLPDCIVLSGKNNFFCSVGLVKKALSIGLIVTGLVGLTGCATFSKIFPSEVELAKRRNARDEELKKDAHFNYYQETVRPVNDFRPYNPSTGSRPLF